MRLIGRNVALIGQMHPRRGLDEREAGMEAIEIFNALDDGFKAFEARFAKHHQIPHGGHRLPHRNRIHKGHLGPRADDRHQLFHER